MSFQIQHCKYNPWKKENDKLEFSKINIVCSLKDKRENADWERVFAKHIW